MFVVLLTYVKPLEEIDALMKDHMAFLNHRYADGTFLVSGRRIPRTGGVILAAGDDEAAIKQIVDQDPFVSSGAATAEIIRFNPSQVAPKLKGIIGK